MKERAGADQLGGLHVIADDDPRWGRTPRDIAAAACEGGARVVQLRAKHLGDREILEQARSIRELTRRAGVAFFVNDRFDLALLAEADGVHLGQQDLPPARIPPAARERLWIGRSTHDRAQWQRACDEPVDYVAFGPVFGTTSKQSAYDARGLPAVREASSDVHPLPLVVIGGIDASRASDVAGAGAAGFAVISAVAAAADMVAATRSLVGAFAGTRAHSAAGAAAEDPSHG